MSRAGDVVLSSAVLAIGASFVVGGLVESVVDDPDVSRLCRAAWACGAGVVGALVVGVVMPDWLDTVRRWWRGDAAGTP
jgi:hypothetical protein